MRTRPLTLAARYIFPVEGPPIEDGLLTIEKGRIARVGPAEGRSFDLDLGNAAIVPGFVNAHTHLELSPLEGDGTGDQVSWLRRVVEHRRGGTPEQLRDAVARNLNAALRAGTTFLADTTTAGLS